MTEKIRHLCYQINTIDRDRDDVGEKGDTE